MSARFEELDWRRTPLGEISLRRRRDPATGTDVYEVKLDDAYLMSSMFTAGERALAELALAELRDAGLRDAEPVGDTAAGVLDVVVGGLGLGHTADAVLRDSRVRTLVVIEALEEVISWHRRGLVPLGERLAGDPRCTLSPGDFFALAAAGEGLDPEQPGRRFHAVLLDVDHSPDHLLHPAHAALYEPPGLRRIADALHPGGVFALWSDDPPSDRFLTALGRVFVEADARTVSFGNPLGGNTSANTVYLARRAACSS
ncbi:spermidine synthase [Streptomyces sp. JJ36]|uniref:spermidine synthase n=1 Tax=Streptomyces sp. JJ36 TaxID=2736645 RepID=UPI001F3BED74|nr:spermidine synthase [Streptomyces sp. JJ36]MCF6524307.1 spermidine synthase [Streptomyces sp. JJ36]